MARLRSGALLVASLVALVAVVLIVALMSGAPPLAASRVVESGRPMPSTLRDGVARQFLTTDSLTLQGQQLVARSRGTVVLLHGLGEHDSAFVHWAAALATASTMNVVSFTLRGNGYGTALPGDVPDTDAYVRDIAAVVHELQRRTPSGPVVLVGVQHGAGLAARYASDAAALQLPVVQGVAVVHPVGSIDSLRFAAIGHGARVQWHERRFAALSWLNRASISMFNGLAVAHQMVPSVNGTAIRHYTYRALVSLSSESVWTSLRGATLPTLALSATPPNGYARGDDAVWTALPAREDLASSTAITALSRWTALFSADAEMPPAILPYQSLPILPPTQ